MKKNFILILSFVLLAIGACSSDDEVALPNAVAFASTSVNLSAETTPIEIKFASPTASAGSLTLTVTQTAVVSGTDFSTTPAIAANTVVVPFDKNVSTVSFTFKKLKEAIEGEVKNVVFTISSVTINSVISENKSVQVNFNETASLGSALAPNVGGPTEPNQVFVDLSSGKMTAVPRVSWDLGFYSGTDYRVIINHTVKMSAKQTTSTNIDEVQTEDATMIFNQGSGSITQVDDPAGDLTKTTIAAISATDSENKVYVINMGSNPGATAPAVGNEGSANGASRGWKKVRILRSGADYKVQYADLAATTHSEITITKNAAYNFTFLSLLTKDVVSVEPQKAQWDISFTSFTNSTNFGTGLVPYNFADFVLNNVKGGAKAYEVLTTAFTYDAFTLANVNNAKFTDDQRNIGSNWRGTVNGTDANGNPVSGFNAKTDRFYVVKDPAGNVYKVRFTAGVNAAGERGYPTLQYAIVK